MQKRSQARPSQQFSQYEVVLPVFKQGDDFAACSEEHPKKPAKAFLALAVQYEEAAARCRRVAAVMAETPSAVAGARRSWGSSPTGF